MSFEKNVPNVCQNFSENMVTDRKSRKGQNDTNAYVAWVWTI